MVGVRAAPSENYRGANLDRLAGDGALHGCAISRLALLIYNRGSAHSRQHRAWMYSRSLRCIVMAGQPSQH